MKRSKRMLTSIIALIATIAVATTTTYAWFTMNETLVIDNFDVTVTSGYDGVYISLDEENYYATVDINDYEYIDNYTAKDLLPAAWYPVNGQALPFAADTDFASWYAGGKTSDLADKDITVTAGSDSVEYTLNTSSVSVGGSTVYRLDGYVYENSAGDDVTVILKYGDDGGKQSDYQELLAQFSGVNGLSHATSADGAVITTRDDSTLVPNSATAEILVPNYTGDTEDKTTVTKESALTYLQIKVYFKATQPYEINLNAVESKLIPQGDTYTSGTPQYFATAANYVNVDKDSGDVVIDDSAALLTNPTTIKARAANAARVGFSDGTTKRIWDPNSQRGYDKFIGYKADGTLAGEGETAVKYGTLAVDWERNTYKGYAKGLFVSPDFYNLYNITNDVIIDNASEAELLTTLVADDGVFTGSLDINVWLEGNDGDCMNNIYGDTFKIELVFGAS